MRKLCAHRDARLYLSGQMLSSIGDNSLWLAMGIWVKILTGSNSAAGLVFFAYCCGTLLSPVCGMVADRLPRKPLLGAANLAGAGLVCLLLLVHSRGGIWLIYLVMFGYGAAGSLISSAQTALLPAIVPGDLLGDANAMLQIGSQGSRLFTPLIGAGLLAWIGAQPVVALDAGTFAVAAAATFALRVRERPAPAAGHWKSEFTAGMRYIRQTVALRRLLVTFVITLTVFGFIETIGYAIVGQGLHRTPPFLGVLIAVMAAGALAGAAVASPVMARTSERTVIAIGLLAIAAGCLLLAVNQLAVVVAACVLVGLSLVWINVGAMTLMQRRTPSRLLGRVDAALNFGATVPQALSIALGAALIAVVNYHLLLVVMAVVIGASVVYLISEPDQVTALTQAPVQTADEAPASDGEPVAQRGATRV
ncbi:MAG TPA: MFS transporter [Streptosporangiaceae bacterium]|jgi:MFS family permease